MSWIYGVCLVVSLAGMVVLDRRFRLFFWKDARRAGIVLVAGVLFFLLWDFAGIGLGVFFRGPSSLVTGLVIAPEVPVEEVLFLTLLSYTIMNVFAAVNRLVVSGDDT